MSEVKAVVKKDTGEIMGWGICKMAPKDDEEIIVMDSEVLIDFQLHDIHGKKQVKWNPAEGKIVHIPQEERVAPQSGKTAKKDWEKMGISEKLGLIAKHLDLIEEE